MPLPSTLEACRADLLTPDSELYDRYPVAMAERIMRIREMYNYWLSNPAMKDRQLRDAIMSRFGVSQSSAYSDLAIIHQLAPLLHQKSREFHRLRTNEMLLETFSMAKLRKDTRTMAQAAATYGKVNRVDLEDEMAMPYDDIVPQPFCPTMDVTVLGLKPIPGAPEFIARLTKELSRDFADIEDVDYEDVDIQEAELFAPLPDNPTT